jgi:hypothetical protein
MDRATAAKIAVVLRGLRAAGAENNDDSPTDIEVESK